MSDANEDTMNDDVKKDENVAVPDTPKTSGNVKGGKISYDADNLPESGEFSMPAIRYEHVTDRKSVV